MVEMRQQLSQEITQQVNVRFDEIVRRLEILQLGQNRFPQPNPQVVEGDDCEEDEFINLLRTVVEIPEFHGGLLAEEFLNWLGTVKEVLDFKEVPENKKVPLVATKIRGRAATWWQQLKVVRLRRGKEKLESWEKMKKRMRVEFLPYNHNRVLYQQLQNLRQGTKSVDDYTKEFYHLIARNDLSDSEEQLVSRYIGGLKQQLHDTLNLFDCYSVSEAHPRAVHLEKQLGGKVENGDSWLRHNIFHITCTVGGKICRSVIDSGSCENVVAEEVVKKLNLETEPHPNPYNLLWLKKGSEVKVDK
ncbi:hypothetical protein IFM89_019372 [Coptis chinensis]|uniref:Retrotransposon gag domain-containing protein n=1 Tax=Coptis chinensis TaxID=261450 RepID=A0A835M5G8_9MAGN|nr:hypothetical protein IFM89_019372 [Coptis chinensis]